MCSALRAAWSAVWVGSFAWLAKISTVSLFLYFKSFCWLGFDANALLCMLRLFGGQTSKYLQNFCRSNAGSAVWVGSFAWLAKIGTCRCVFAFIIGILCI